MSQFNVGDRVRILEGGRKGQTATVTKVRSWCEQGYDVIPEGHDRNLWYAEDELEYDYSPTPQEKQALAEWEIELLLDPRDNDTIYEKVCKERGTIPENWM